MKLGVVASNTNFVQPIIAELLQRGHHLIQYQETGDAVANSYQIGRIVENAERIFVDWIQPPAWRVIEAAQCPVVARLHRFEVYQDQTYFATHASGQRVPFPWNKVERLLFVAEHVKARFVEFGKQHLGVAPQKLTVIPHVGVDMEKFVFAKRNWEPPWTILCAGNISPKKRQYTILQLLRDLPEEFRLQFVGSMGPPGYGNAEYGMNCTDYSMEHGLQPRANGRASVPHDEMPLMCADAHLVINASNEEGCATAVAEGMATGCLPLVNAWRGAGDLYPKGALWHSPKDFYRLCEEFAAMSPEQKVAKSRAARRWVAKRYDQKAIVKQTCDYIQGTPKGEFYDGWLQHFVEQRDNDRNQLLGQWLVEHLNPYTHYLEVGCSIGRQCEIARAVAQQGRVVGIDLSGECLRYAANRARALQQDAPQADWNIEYAQMDATQQLPPGEWDVVAVFDTLEHIHPDAHPSLFARIASALKPGGRVLINFPYRGEDQTQLEEFRIFPKLVRQHLRAAGLKCDPGEQVFSPWPGEEYFRVEGVKA